MKAATKSSTSSPPFVEQPFRSLIRVFGLVRRVMEPYFARFGVSGAQWGVLRALRRAEDEGQSPVRLTDLSNYLLVRPPSVTGTVDRLVRMGLVARVAPAASEDDHRVKRVHLTSAGRKLVRRILQHHPTQVELMLAGLDPAERREFQRLLLRFGDHLETLVDQPNGHEKNDKVEASVKS